MRASLKFYSVFKYQFLMNGMYRIAEQKCTLMHFFLLNRSILCTLRCNRVYAS